MTHNHMDDVRALMVEINRKHGEGLVLLASQISDAVPRIPTGSLSLDIILGGGWPANQWSEIIGSESEGKTAVALKTIATNQERDPEFTTIWIAAEKWVNEYAQMCGVDLERVAVVETNDMEMAYDVAIKFAHSRAADCIVIDSLPALVPGDEDNKDMEGTTVGKGALLTGKFFRKVGKATKRSLIEQERPILGLVINQWRQKIGVIYGDNRTTPGGVGKNYAFFVRLEVRRDSKWIEVGEDQNKERIGQTIHFRTLKNKTAPAQRTAMVDFYFSDGGSVKPGDYDSAKEIVSVATIEEVIKRSGAYYSFGENRWRGQHAMLDEIRQNVDLYNQIRDEVLYIVEHAAR